MKLCSRNNMGQFTSLPKRRAVRRSFRRPGLQPSDSRWRASFACQFGKPSVLSLLTQGPLATQPSACYVGTRQISRLQFTTVPAGGQTHERQGECVPNTMTRACTLASVEPLAPPPA